MWCCLAGVMIGDDVADDAGEPDVLGDDKLRHEELECCCF